MSTLPELIRTAYALRASDLHLEPGLPPAFRVDGALSLTGPPVAGGTVREMARSIAGTEGWDEFRRVRSLDLSKSIAGVRCRINVLHTRRGVGMAVRLLTTATATVDSLNLHPSIRELAMLRHGLVLVCGPTGSGKSSTIAALVQEVNLRAARHVITLEQPVEYRFKPHRAFIRQREVGRDTPTFEQGLLDALREDPDVLVVGEMRRPETMRLTLDAAETGHLVLTTVHSSSCAEALQRVVSAFPAEGQAAVRAQLADCLSAVICQHLVFRQDLGIRVPECEILRVTDGVRGSLREGRFRNLATALETGADSGSWTVGRYRRWLQSRESFVRPPKPSPGATVDEVEAESNDLAPRAEATPRRPARVLPAPPPAASRSQGVFVLDDDGTDAGSILSELLSD